MSATTVPSWVKTMDHATAAKGVAAAGRSIERQRVELNGSGSTWVAAHDAARELGLNAFQRAELFEVLSA